MIKKIVFSFLMLSLSISPFITNASTFTNLKSQLFYLSEKIANFDNTSKVNNNGDVLGISISSLNLLSPNGGETFRTTDPVIINWESSLPSNLKLDISLVLDSQVYLKIKSTTVGAGSTTINMPYSGINNIYGNHYKVSLKVLNYDVVYEDLSNSSFNLYPLYCYNGVQDEDETGVNIGPSCPLVYSGVCPAGAIGTYPNCATPSIYSVPRIAYWSGKINQHFDILSKTWQSDPDGVSGSYSDDGSTDPLNYCKKWYPKTTSIKTYKSETIYTWKNSKFDVQDYYTGTITSIECFSKLITTDENVDVTKKEEIRTGGEEGNFNYCTFVFDKNFGYWASDTKTNKEVSILQSVLVDEGFLTNKEVTGKFYLKTKNALILLQKKYDLYQTGRVDTMTRNKLNSLYKEYCNK